MAEPRLTGYAYSVYTRAARMALQLKDVAYTQQECDPFDPEQQAALRQLHPFGRVPVLEHDGFRVWETQAILDYIDFSFEGPPLTPPDVKARARMRQVMGIVDHYIYWPMVRQVVSEALFQPLFAEQTDHQVLHRGLEAAPTALAALEEMAAEGVTLGKTPGLADCLLWPMLDYFRQVPQGAALLAQHPALGEWCDRMEAHPVAMATKPNLSQLAEGNP